jgi:DNA-binding transcriptional regulator YdaS (Cro superfamily)
MAKKRRDPVVTEAIARMGSLQALADAIGLKHRQAVWKWRRIPPNHVIAVERVTGIPRERLRPDLYDVPRPGEFQRACA